MYLFRNINYRGRPTQGYNAMTKQGNNAYSVDHGNPVPTYFETSLQSSSITNCILFSNAVLAKVKRRVKMRDQE